MLLCLLCVSSPSTERPFLQDLYPYWLDTVLEPWLSLFEKEFGVVAAGWWFRCLPGTRLKLFDLTVTLNFTNNMLFEWPLFLTLPSWCQRSPV